MQNRLGAQVIGLMCATSGFVMAAIRVVLDRVAMFLRSHFMICDGILVNLNKD
jgi:hypothetical protein